MSVAIKSKPRSAAQRAKDATDVASRELDLVDQKMLTTALLEAAAEGVRRNVSFAAHVRSIYRQLEAQTNSTPKPRPTRPSADVDLIPIKRIEGREANPAAPPDAFFLHELYGSSQLRLALERYSVPKLQQAVAAVQKENPGTKPSNKARKDSIIDYIVEHVAGPGY